MPLDSGTLTIWRGTNTASAGGMPAMKYKQLLGAYYQDRTIGVQRWYTAQQHGDRPDFLVRVPRTWELSAATDRVILEPFGWQDNGGAYQMLQIQQVLDDNGLPATDLTLERDDGIDAGALTCGAGGAD